jgi:cytochrome d ubiquinol oxidase subunit I
MKVEDAATGNSGVWITFLLVLGLYIGLGVTTVLILRKMSRRYRERELTDDEVPYGPRAPIGEATDADDREEVSIT